MSEAIEYTTPIYTELDHARRERLKSTLIFLTKEYRESRSKMQELGKEIQVLTKELKETVFKRKRLMKQNFSGSEHLKKTHTKYWSEIQGKVRIYQVKLSQYQYYKEKVDLLVKKIPEIKDQIFANINY